MPITTIKQGESLDYEFDRDGESIAGWVCTINLKQYPDDTPIIKRVITPTGDVWSGTLTNQDTKNLDVGQYLLIGKLTNASTGENEQDIIRFYVSVGY
jgi:hypothetical protein